MKRTSATLVMIGLVLLSVGALPASAGESRSLPEIRAEYDPDLDIVVPSAARWLYLGTLFPVSATWGEATNAFLGFDYSDRRATAVRLLVTPASFFGFLWATRHRKTTLGMVSASWNGTWHGFGAGFVVGDLLYDWGQREQKFNPKQGTAVAGSVAGHIIGLRHAECERLNSGNAEMLSQAGAWAALYSAYFVYLPLPWSSDFFGESGIPWRRKLVEAAGLAGWYGGLRLWNRNGPRDYTGGDAVSTWNSNSMSILTAVAAGSLMPELWRDGEWSDKGASLLPALVNAGGLYYGYRFHRNRDVAFGQSLLVSLGTVLGASSVGAAVAILATPEDKEIDERLALVTAAAGGWAGFHLTHWLLDTGRPAESRTGVREEPFRVTFMPGNALGILVAAKTGRECRAPLLLAQF